MTKTGKRRSSRSTRAPLRPPGRPPVVHRAERRPFWEAIAAGLTTEEAARVAGVSSPVGVRWFRKCGGMPPAHLAVSVRPGPARYLSLAEREELAILQAQGLGVRASARCLGRAPSTISRELRRNASTRSGDFVYRATTAQWHADRAATRPKASRLATNDALRTYVAERLAGAVVTPAGVALIATIRHSNLRNTMVQAVSRSIQTNPPPPRIGLTGSIRTTSPPLTRATESGFRAIDVSGPLRATRA